MAIINKIREKAGIAVTIVAGGLVLFLFGRDIPGLNAAIFGKNHTDVGEIFGEKIKIQDYQQQLEALKYNFYLRYGHRPTESEQTFLSEQTWELLVKKIAYQKEYDALGLQVTEDELIDMVQGNNIHPDVKAAFRKAETDEFDQQQVVNYLQNFSQMPAEQQRRWYSFEKSLISTRLNTKLNHLLSKSAFTTSLEKEQNEYLEQTTSQIKYLYIPYYTFPDSLVRITQAMLQNYLKQHKHDYQVKESRAIQYITFPIIPSQEDTLAWQQALKGLLQTFKTTKNDSTFALLNTDGRPNLAYRNLSQAQLPMALTKHKHLRKGLVIGPIEEAGKYSLYKIAAVTSTQPARYTMATIEKKLTAGNDAHDKAFRKANAFASISTQQKTFEKNAQKNELKIYNAEKVTKNDTRVGIFKQAREVVQWLYRDGAIGKVSPVFELENNYAIAVMTGKTAPGLAPLASIDYDLKRKIKNQRKAKKIIAKLEKITDQTLENKAEQYGNAAKIQKAEAITWQDNTLPNVGAAYTAIGKAFALKAGEQTLPFEEENGVLIVQLLKKQKKDNKKAKTTTHKTDDKVNAYILQIQQQQKSKQLLKAMEALGNMQDWRYQFF